MAISEKSVAREWRLETHRLRVTRIIPLALFLAAFLSRLMALGRYVTPDEPIWVYRSLRFREAVMTADWTNTIQSGHPGVITTWLGAIAVQLQLWLHPESGRHLDWISKLYWLAPDNGEAIRHLVEFLTAARLGVILVTSSGLVAIYWLSRYRLGLWPAFLGALFLALDPFAAGLSGLLHVDALLATFMLISVLLVLPKMKGGPPATGTRQSPVTGYHLALAGVTTALAILSKSPGLFLLLFVPVLILWPHVAARTLGSGVRSLLYWGGPMLLTLLILLPALWADPLHTIEMITGLAGRLIDSAVRPTFFLGEVTLEPGSSFYPLAVAFRLSPVVTLGLLALFGWLIYQLVAKRILRMPANVLWLLLFSLTFLLFINVSAKRFDRYALPAIVSLILVSGWAVANVAGVRLSSGGHRLPMVIALAVTGLLLFGYWLASLPYSLSAYNWLLGGPVVAQKVLPVGWGEGTSAAARWAATLPDAEQRTLSTYNVPAAAPFFPGRLLRLDRESLAWLGQNDLISFEAQDWQRDPTAFRFDDRSGSPLPADFGDLSLVHTVNFNGLPRATLHSGLGTANSALENVSRQQQSVNFEGAIQIVSTGALPAAWPDDLQVAIEWLAIQPADFQLLLELVDDTNYSWARRELPLLNDVDHPARYWPVGESQIVTYRIPVPADIPPGTYDLVVSLFDAGGALQGVFDTNGRFRGTAANVATLALDPPTDQPAIDIPIPLSLDNELAGYDTPPAQVSTGQQLTLDLWWRPKVTTPQSSQLALQLGPANLVADLAMPNLRQGQTAHIRPSWRIPADLPPGTYSLTIQLVDGDGQPQWSEAVTLERIEVVAQDRVFELPSGLTPLKIQLGRIAILQHAAVELDEGEVAVTLTWQAAQHDDRSYTVFVHLRDAAGNILDQVDRPPSEPTNTWLPGQVVADHYRLPAPDAGRYELAIGLYDAASGQRMPVYAADGTPMADDQYTIGLDIP